MTRRLESPETQDAAACGMLPSAAAAGPFEHPALFYSGPVEFVDAVSAFVREGLAAGEPVCVATPGPNLELLRSALGPAAAEVRMVDMAQAGRNPNRIIPNVLREFADRHAGRRARIVGEPVWAGRPPLEYAACVQHEALINLAFAGRDATILCPYDVAALGARELADAMATHPALWDAAGRRPSASFAPERVIESANRPLGLPRQAVTLRYDRGSLFRARRLAEQQAARAGLDAERVRDFVLAVDELAVNTVMHGGGQGTLRVWTEGEHLLAEVRDAGRITDPLAGRRPVDPVTPGGRGLLMVNRLAELVRIYHHPGGGAVRVYFAR